MSGQLYDAPNQQVVRPDGSAPWDEGDGGSQDAASDPSAQDKSLDEMTKNELLAYAEAHDVADVNASMTKEEIREKLG